MFSGFKRAIPQITIFHRAASPQSMKALAMLRAANSSPYPPSGSQPLHFDLDVVEAPPTSDQLQTIVGFLPASATSSIGATFLSSHPSSSDVSSDAPAEGIVQMATKNPNVFKWPVVVNWDAGKASVGDLHAVTEMLEGIRKKRDGESKEEEEHKPKGWFS